MTKKDYEKFAALLRNLLPHDEEHLITNGKIRDHHVRIIAGVAGIFAEDNPNFNINRFIAAITKR